MSIPIDINSHNLRLYNLDISDANHYLLEHIHRQYMENPMSFLEVDKKDAEHLTGRITSFLIDCLKKSGMKGYVVGLSGGIDSSIAAALAAKAVGKENVYGMLLPSKFTSQEHIDDACILAQELGIKFNKNSYSVVMQWFDDTVDNTMRMTQVSTRDPKYKIVLANNHARERMKILRGKAQQLDYLVLGTTNMTEAWLGYATIAGDGYKGIDIEPLQMLPKTSERIYAELLGIPEQIITKAPTAGLWEGQTDEDEIGLAYEDIDRIMTGYFLSRRIIEKTDRTGICTQNSFKMLYDTDKEQGQAGYSGISVEDIIRVNKKQGITRESIEKLISRAKGNAFKAKPEPFADLTKKWWLKIQEDKEKRMLEKFVLQEKKDDA